MGGLFGVFWRDLCGFPGYGGLGLLWCRCFWGLFGFEPWVGGLWAGCSLTFPLVGLCFIALGVALSGVDFGFLCLCRVDII